MCKANLLYRMQAKPDKIKKKNKKKGKENKKIKERKDLNL